MANDKKMKIGIIIIIIMIILIDQFAKIVIINNNDQNIWGISLSYEPEEKRKTDEIITSVITDIVVFAIIIKFLKEQGKNMETKVKVSLACILGAGISNLIDKIWNRNVINFIKIGKLPAINVAYIILIISWILFIIFMVKSTMKVKEEIKQIDQQRKSIGR